MVVISAFNSYSFVTIREVNGGCWLKYRHLHPEESAKKTRSVKMVSLQNTHPLPLPVNSVTAALEQRSS